MSHKDPEQLREYKRQYAERNREKISDQKAQYYQENREVFREADRKRYRQRNPEKTRAYNQAYQQRNREALRAYHRRKYLENREARLAYDKFARHGLRPDQWAALYAEQSGQCYACGNELGTGRQVAVDHDHSHCGPRNSCSACRRGLACMDCNIAFGHVHDDPARLRRMADALEAAQRGVDQRKAAAACEQLTLEEASA